MYDMARRPQKHIFLYVLRLQGGKYYVGQSRNLPDRIRKHFAGKGAVWTQLHAPLEVIKTIELDTTSWVTAAVIETHLTLDLMKIYGTDNVRGGAYTGSRLPLDPDTYDEE